MRADVSFRDVQKLASGNYLCLCGFLYSHTSSLQTKQAWVHVCIADFDVKNQIFIHMQARHRRKAT